MKGAAVMFKKIMIVLSVCVATTVVPAWGLDLNPGKFEITAEVEMPGMPRGMQAQTITQCLTRQEPVPDASAGAQGCEVTDIKTSGNTVTYTMVCEQQGMKTKSAGEIIYRGDSFEGTTRTAMGPQEGGMTITTKIKGSRIGPCE
jgi:hypothetical protein